ncbi:unnamed protein product, partial [Ectocarpus sp. 4 AP-2014]
MMILPLVFVRCLRSDPIIGGRHPLTQSYHIVARQLCSKPFHQLSTSCPQMLDRDECVLFISPSGTSLTMRRDPSLQRSTCNTLSRSSTLSSQQNASDCFLLCRSCSTTKKTRQRMNSYR